MKLISSEREKKSLKVSFLYGEKNLWYFLCAINLVLESGGNIIFCGGSLTTTAKKMRDEKIVFNFSNLHLTHHRRSTSFHWKNSGCTQRARWVGSSAIFSWARTTTTCSFNYVKSASQPSEGEVFQRNIKAYKKKLNEFESRRALLTSSALFRSVSCCVYVSALEEISRSPGELRVELCSRRTLSGWRSFKSVHVIYLSSDGLNTFFMSLEFAFHFAHSLFSLQFVCFTKKKEKKQTACNIKKSIRRTKYVGKKLLFHWMERRTSWMNFKYLRKNILLKK